MYLLSMPYLQNKTQWKKKATNATMFMTMFVHCENMEKEVKKKANQSQQNTVKMPFGQLYRWFGFSRPWQGGENLQGWILWETPFSCWKQTEEILLSVITKNFRMCHLTVAYRGSSTNTLASMWRGRRLSWKRKPWNSHYPSDPCICLMPPFLQWL